MSEKNYDSLCIIKEDKEFESVIVKPEYSNELLDVADWVEYTCAGRKFAMEKKQCEKDLDKIVNDTKKKPKGALQMSEKFWSDAF